MDLGHVFHLFHRDFHIHILISLISFIRVAKDLVKKRERTTWDKINHYFPISKIAQIIFLQRKESTL